MSRCEKQIAERPQAVVPASDVLSGPGELAAIRITGVTTIGNKKPLELRQSWQGLYCLAVLKALAAVQAWPLAGSCTVFQKPCI